MENKNILVIGGAGYIGSVATKRLVEEGYKVSVFDNLSKGRKELVDKDALFFEGDILDEKRLDEVFGASEYDAVIHFAALKDAGESMREPEMYSKNLVGTINILNAMSRFGVKKIVFSSSAAVYGAPMQDCVDENHQTEPLNFYGFTKLEGERMMEWYRKLRDIEYVSLRYFNVAGDGGLDYLDPDARNIFPIIAEVASGKRDVLKIFGGDYDTKDGTGVRDYIHVIDLVDAHIDALEVEGSHIINLGSGAGYSVFDLVKAFEEVVGKDLSYEIVSRRPGDPAFLVASYDKAKEILGWEPKLGLDEMVKSTWSAYDK